MTCGPCSFQMQGVVHGSTMDRNIVEDGCYERPVVEKVIETTGRGDIVWDVGTGVGYYALVFAQILDSPEQIFCVEGSGKQIRRFERNFRGQTRRPKLIRALVSDATAPGRVTLDQMWRTKMAPAPTAIKMDIEGAELFAIEGARELIAEVRPKLFIEVHPQRISRFAPDGVRRFFDPLFEHYDIDYVRNHWGSFKGDGTTEWQRGTRGHILAMCDDIVISSAFPRAFMIYCHAK
ncbi:MAG: FkbM family methyltransferase [Acidobacteriota bacterium]|nr:FkbM family methyltransferase [Acidobacteriota bacterium]